MTKQTDTIIAGNRVYIYINCYANKTINLISYDICDDIPSYNPQENFTISFLARVFPKARTYIAKKLKEHKKEIKHKSFVFQKIKNSIATSALSLNNKVAIEKQYSNEYKDILYSLKRKIEREKLFIELSKPIVQKKGNSKITQQEIQQAKTVAISDVFPEIKKERHNSCFFHSEKTASMYYYNSNNRVHCFGFGCNKSASVIDLVMHRYGLSFIDAVKYLNKK